MSAKFVQIVDEKDRPAGEALNVEAWKKGLTHRIAMVMLYDQKGRLLLQHRSKKVETWPGTWTCSASGHVDIGETYAQAAKRELAEELGITNLPLEEVGYGYFETEWADYKLKRFVKIYRATLNEAPNNLDENEVTSVRWFELDELDRLLKEQPERFMGGFREAYYRFIK